MSSPALVFKCFYPGKQPIEIFTATSSYNAQCRAAEVWNLKPSQRYKVSVMLLSKDGQAVTHIAVD